jgi:hypothetical protein
VSWVSHTLKDAAGSKDPKAAGAGSSSSGQPHPLESFDDAGEAQEAAAAAAAGDLVDMQLYAPGRLLYVKVRGGAECVCGVQHLCWQLCAHLAGPHHHHHPPSSTLTALCVHIRTQPIDGAVPDEQQHFELVDGGAGETAAG